jgi:hypothetical protein
MRRPAPHTRPPSIAAWLVSLFGSADQAESILGDLEEEFSEIASKSAAVSARGWYWRQSLKTIAQLAGAGVRNAPWPLAGLVLAGFLLQWFSTGLPERVIVAILRTQRPYSNLHYDFYISFLTYGFPIAGDIQSILLGCFVAAFARQREVIATTALSFFGIASIGLLFFGASGHGSRFAYSWPFPIMQLINQLAIVLGGVIVREIRLALRKGCHEHDFNWTDK